MTRTRAKPAAIKADAAPMADEAPKGPITVLTKSAGTLGPYGFTAGLLIEGVPRDLAKANASWMESNPEKVGAAKAAGADSVPIPYLG